MNCCTSLSTTMKTLVGFLLFEQYHIYNFYFNVFFFLNQNLNMVDHPHLQTRCMRYGNCISGSPAIPSQELVSVVDCEPSR